MAKHWIPLEDSTAINVLFEQLINQSQAVETALRDKYFNIIFPEKPVPTLPMKLYKGHLVIYTEQELSTGPVTAQFFLADRRFLVECVIDLNRSEKRFYGKIPRKLQYIKARAIYKIHKNLQSRLIVSIPDGGTMKPKGYVIDAAYSGFGIFSRSPFFYPDQDFSKISIAFFPYLNVVFPMAKVKVKRGYFNVVIIDPLKAQLDVNLELVTQPETKKKLEHYQKIFRFDTFLEDFLIQQIRKVEQELIRLEKEDAARQQERIQFYFGANQFIDSEDSRAACDEIAIFELPILQVLSKRLAGIRNLTLHLNSEKKLDITILQNSSLICVDYNIVVSQLSFFKPFKFKTIVMFDTTDSSRAPILAETYQYLGALSYTQMKIYTQEQLFKALTAMLMLPE